MTLARPCRVCGRPGKAICDRCALIQRSLRPKRPNVYRQGNYQSNRKKMIEIAWEHHLCCALCGLPFARREDITADHIVPVRNGGTHDLSNLQPSHLSCNTSRH